MRSQAIGLLGIVFIIISGSFLCIIPPLLSDEIFPTMYTLDLILEEKALYNNFLYVSLFLRKYY